ncbi:copper homeostasis membrane protein CopD [Phenylobacterium sp. 20VBR1]|uniref:Copper homeostasis membrane protein CopD n=1 Tax=Phenylobacterium glaciei TaxID=2803784 RepID=A0A941D0N8_9CAUL|nr:copper homeostasis membrane protein CopD [Phenylobacterium glaciei]
MLEPAVIVLRLLEFAGAMILFGSSLFLLYALPQDGAGSGAELGWPQKALVWAAGVVLAASVVGLLAHTSILAGSIREGMTASSLSAVMTTMSMGPSTLIRAGAAALALVALARRVSRTTWWLCAGLGAVISASFAWMGHGAATEGALGLLHLSADILHTLAAGAWIGALVAFFLLLRPRAPSVMLDGVLHNALHDFSGVGTGLVAVIVATGLVNSWFLVGPARISGLWTTPYGQLLSLKLVLFVSMLALAAANRFRLTPALGAAIDGGQASDHALDALRRSLLFETALSILVLGLVAWLGTLAPVSAG